MRASTFAALLILASAAGCSSSETDPGNGGQNSTARGGSGGGGTGATDAGGDVGGAGGSCSSTPGLVSNESSLTFAALGDSGYKGFDDLGIGKTPNVAQLIHSWSPDFVMHLGDLNYPVGAQETVADNIHAHFGRYIQGYQGDHGCGPESNRFFPTPGNHDYKTDKAQPYLDAIPYLEGRRYYEADLGLVHLFSLDTENDDEARDLSSPQGQWFLEQVAKSDACWKIVFFHRAAYTSGKYHDRPAEDMRYPYRENGIDAVLWGHDHVYERFDVDGFPYFTVGTGGAGLYDFDGADPGSVAQVRDYGAMKVDASRSALKFQFFTAARPEDGKPDSELRDSFELTKSCP